MSSDGRRIIYEIDGRTRIIFGLDLGENAHPIRSAGYFDPVNHMNIEIQTISEAGNASTKWDMHLILDDNNSVIDKIITGPWKDK